MVKVMPNSQQHATRWLKLIEQQPLPSSDIFASHVAVGQITSLCACGCHGFRFSIPEEHTLQPLTHRAGLYCELAFESDQIDEINILLFTDARGYFERADITIGQANRAPMQDDATATALIGIWSSDSTVMA
jgi:hypothetical protein